MEVAAAKAGEIPEEVQNDESPDSNAVEVVAAKLGAVTPADETTDHEAVSPPFAEACAVDTSEVVG